MAETFLEAAERNYGEGGEIKEVGTLHASWAVPDLSKVKAGEQVILKLEWKLEAAATYIYTAKPEPLFDCYKNTTITLTLPEGVEIVKDVEGALSNVKEIRHEGTRWTLVLDNENTGVASAQGGDISVPLNIGKNGQRPVGEELDFSLDTLDAVLHTEFTIMDRTGEEDKPSEKTYVKDFDNTNDLGRLTVYTDDVWGIEKVPGTATPSGDKSTVSITYELTVGLMNGDTLVTNPESYSRNGRVPFDTVALKESLTVVDRSGAPLEPVSVTVKPKFGNGQEITVANNGSIGQLPLDTRTLSNGAEVPYLSNYTVTAVYDYAKFIAQYYDANQQKLDVKNTATLTYRLQGQGQETSDEATATVQAGEVTQPAAINICKYIQGSSVRIYSAKNFPVGDPVSGPATFTITKESGEAATIYLKQADGTYKAHSGNTVTIDPAGSGESNSTSGEITIYLDPGTYMVTESDTLPTNTQKVAGGTNNAEPKTVTVTAGGEAVNADFYNKEVLGSIVITKLGQKEGKQQPQAGAEFTLYQGTGTTGTAYQTVSSNDKGEVIFSRLPYGTYTVKETKAPDGYIADRQTWTVTINENKVQETWSVINKENLAYVILTKKMFNGVDYVPVTEEFRAEFNNAFTLEKLGSNGWEKVGNAHSLNEGGIITLQLPVYDESGTAISYRFNETLPAGWHDPGEAEAKSKVSRVFTLENALGKGVDGAEEVEMENDRNGSITLTKKFYQRQSNNTFKQEANKETTFTLYRMVEGQIATKVAASTFTGTVTFNDLSRTDGSGNAYLYYLVETPVAGYLADTTGTTTIDIGNGQTLTAWGPINFVAQRGGQVADLDQALTVNNYSQTLPVTVKKVDSVTNSFVNGSAFTVYKYDENKPDHLGDQVGTENQQISSSAGVTLYLEAGEKYIVKETTVPSGYHDVTPENERIIDLTAQDPVGSGTTYKTITITLKNQPDPKLLVEKTLLEDGKSSVLNGVQFEVYKGSDDSPDINTGSVATVVSGTAKQLPAGTYWLKEIAGSQVLDPAKYPELYEGKGKAVGADFYFGPFVIAEADDNATLTQSVTIENYSMKGSVQATKWARGINGNLTPLKGAVLAIYNQNDPGTEPARATTDANGQVTFKNLDIYGQDGKKITYLIKEVQAPSGYSPTEAVLQVTLEPGQTVQVGGKDDTEQLIDLPLLSFQVTKVFYNIWEHQFVPKEFFMAGAQIALYEKVEEEGTFSYKFLQLATTDDMGMVTFEDLAQETEYVAIEYSIPNVEEYKYLGPIAEGKEYLITAADNEGNPPASLTEAEIEKYYFVTKEALADVTKPEQLVQKTLTNVEHWAQLHIEKFIIRENEGQQTEYPINNAEFDLYMEVLDEETAAGALTFDKNKIGNGYTLVGSYTSGTLYSADGVRQDGWFGTNILKSADNVVYWLVERTGGIGANIRPSSQVTLIKRSGTEYSNDSTSLDGTAVCSNVLEYKDDKVTEGRVENDPATGEGFAMFSTIRIAKWAGELNQDGDKVKNYTALGNATFEVWLTHADGTLVEKLDTITTGLDNNQTGGTSGELTAWASSKAFNFDDLWNKYKGDNTQGVSKDVIWWDGAEEASDGYARVVLVESSAPAGYQTIQKGLQLLVFFDYDNGKTTEVFNDAYYVKTEEGTEPLAEDNNGWAFYPTKETGDPGQYEPIQDVAGMTSQYRIVDWPVDNFAVTVNKYGYQVNSQNLNMSSEELSEYYLTHAGREALSVTMKLQRWSSSESKWVDYTYPNYDGTSTAVFTTTDGTFSFPKGLNVGRYRIIEQGSPADYDNIYDGSAVSGDNYYNAKAYYFQVTNDNLVLDLYNPGKVDLSLEKTNTQGTGTLSGAVFSLNRSGSTTPLTATTGSDGQAEFRNLRTGVYTLSETTAPGGCSKEYLSLYFESAFATGHTWSTYALKNFTSSGIFLGYVTELRNGQVVVTDQITLADYGINDLTLDVQDPQLGSLTIKKVDKDQPTKTLEDAEFTLYHLDFSSWADPETLPTTGWTQYPDGDTTYPTGADGTVTIEDLEPGFYKIEETKAPSGYDKAEEPQYVVITGGMSKNITGSQTFVTDPTSPVEFRNAKQVSLNVYKEVLTGDLTVEEEHTFTFTLYEDGPNGTKAEREVTVPVGAENHKQYAPKQPFTGLSQGKTYYLTETGDSHFALDSVVGAVDTDKDGYYEFTVPTDGSDVTITAKNTYLYAEVTILKVDAADGTPRDGAAFGAYLKSGDHYMTNTTGEWTDHLDEDSGNSVGEYTVRLPLRDASGNSFKIQELNTPVGYVNDYPYTEVTVEPGKCYSHGTYDPDTMCTGDRTKDDAAMLAALIFPNYKGSIIEIVKYNNMKESSNPQVIAGVPFNLYTTDGNGGWTLVTTQTTGANGKVSFTVTSGRIYAVAETVPIGYAGLQGLYSGNSAMPAVTATIEGKPVTLYQINGGNPLTVSQTYSYNAYNIPLVDLEIRKQDALNPNKNTQPTAVVNVYEVPNSTSTTLTQAEVENLMTSGTPVQLDVNVNALQSSANEKYNNVRLADAVQPGKTYLVVETSSSMTQIRDNNQVVWYKVLKVAPGATDTQVVTLKNLTASVKSSLEKKTTATTSYPNLLTQSAELEYTITPSVNNTYPLDSFVLKDNGLAAFNGTKELAFDTYLKEKYSITSVTVGQATHNTGNYLVDPTGQPVKATVKFYDFNDQEITGSTKTVDVSNSSQVVNLTGNVKAMRVEVSYHCDSFQAATGYVLGQNFTANPVTVKIHLDQQKGGTGVESITQVTNNAETAATWSPWNEQGQKLGSQTQTASAQASDTFAEQKYARVTVDKTADKGTANLNNDVVTYTVTITNTEKGEAPFTRPFLVNLLPQGTILNGEPEDAVKLVKAPEGMIIENIRTETQNGETALFVFLSGNTEEHQRLDPGESAQVEISVQTTNAAALYGASFVNYVILGSRLQGVESASNPRSTSWMTEDGKMPGGLENVLTSLHAQRLEDFKKMLGTEFSGFGYISDAVGVTWTAGSEAAVTKMGKGDRTSSTGFTTDRLSAVNNDGTMDYRLIFSNLSTIYNYTGVTLLDVLPYDGDKVSSGADRYSEWGLIFGDLTRVERVAADGSTTQISADSYKLFYYTQPITDGNVAQIYDQVNSIEFNWTPANGWTDAKPADPKTITAIAVAFQKNADVSLAPKESYQIEYRMDVGQLNEAELADRSWQNTVNSFVAQYWRYTDNVGGAVQAKNGLGSNSVAATILPGQVQVGGHVWIDKNADGVWDKATESVSALQNNTLVQQLLNNIQIRLSTYEGTGESASATREYNTSGDANWNQNAEFVFGRGAVDPNFENSDPGLDPASPSGTIQDDGNELYDISKGQLNQLKPEMLKGYAPKTYRLSVTIPEAAGVLAEPTILGATSGRSRDPLSVATSAEAADNNFAKAASGTTSSNSERFYLHATEPTVYDNTKDIGLILFRNVTVKKTAADDPNTPVEGAEFTIYGPYNSLADAQSAALSSTESRGTYTTRANGEVSLGQRNWFQYYVIVETKAAPGYLLDGATFTNTDGVLEKYTGTGTTNPAWVLTVPGDGVTNTNQVVNVTNIREAKVALEAEKTLTGQGTLAADQFTFQLLNDKFTVIQEKKNAAGGTVTFDPIALSTPAKYTYYIREKVPTEAAGGNRYQGTLYDETLYKAEVTVSLNSTGMSAQVNYFKQDATGAWTAVTGTPVFTNDYSPSPAQYAPQVEKIIQTTAGDAAKDPFTFTIERTDSGQADAVEMPALTTLTINGNGKGSFGSITFKRAGTYTFQIKEEVSADLEGLGYTFDTQVWTLTVEVQDNDGVIAVTKVEYTSDSGAASSEEQASFTNQYDPKETSYVPKVRKVLTGDKAPNNSTFRFDLTLKSEPVPGGAVLAADPGASITGAGTVNLPEIFFRAAGKYTFTITEKAGKDPAFRYDGSTWILTVEVKDDGNGGLVVDSAVYRKGLLGGANQEATFTNKYKKPEIPDNPPPTTTNPPIIIQYFLPKTGDEAQLGIWLAILATASGGLVWMRSRKKKNTRR